MILLKESVAKLLDHWNTVFTWFQLPLFTIFIAYMYYTVYYHFEDRLESSEGPSLEI